MAGSPAAVGSPSGLSAVGLTLMEPNLLALAPGSVSVGVGDADGGQDLGLQALHLLGVVVGVMVVAQEVQQTVHHEMLEMMPGLDTAAGRFLADGLGGQH